MTRRLLSIWAILVVGTVLLIPNSALLLTSTASSCTAECPGADDCTCSGTTCSAKDGVGCSGSTGGDTSKCTCGKSIQ